MLFLRCGLCGPIEAGFLGGAACKCDTHKALDFPTFWFGTRRSVVQIHSPRPFSLLESLSYAANSALVFSNFGIPGECALLHAFLLDGLGSSDYIPRCSRRGRSREQTTRPSARHSRHADPQVRIPRPIARLRHSAAHPADFERPLGN